MSSAHKHGRDGCGRGEPTVMLRFAAKKQVILTGHIREQRGTRYENQSSSLPSFNLYVLMPIPNSQLHLFAMSVFG